MTNKRQVDYFTGSQFAEQNGMKFLETCAFDLKTVELVFNAMLEDIIENIDSGKLDEEYESLGIILQGKRNESHRNTNIISIHNSNIGGSKERKKCCNIF